MTSRFFSRFDNQKFIDYCNSSHTDYFGCWVISKHEGVKYGRGSWRYYHTSYAVISRFASMFSYIPDAEIDFFCVHFNK